MFLYADCEFDKLIVYPIQYRVSTVNWYELIKEHWNCSCTMIFFCKLYYNIYRSIRNYLCRWNLISCCTVYYDKSYETSFHIAQLAINSRLSELNFESVIVW